MINMRQIQADYNAVDFVSFMNEEEIMSLMEDMIRDLFQNILI